MNKFGENDWERVAKITDQIQGYLLHPEGKLLYQLAKACSKKAAIVEIGSWKGRSTVWLYFGSVRGNRAPIYAIDPHTGSPELKKRHGGSSSLGEFKDNMKRIKAFDLVIPLVKKSKEAAGEFGQKVGLVFIDGDHSCKAVKEDFELWFPKLINKGLILFHDTIQFEEVNRVVREMVFKSKKIKNIKIVDSIVWGQKCQKLSVVDCLRNRYVLFLHDFSVFFSKFNAPYFLVNFGKNILKKIH